MRCIFVLLCYFCCYTSALADSPPCSQRYLSAVHYSVEEKDIGKSSLDILSRWGIKKNHWGFERIIIAGQGDNKTPVLQFFYPQGSINPSNEAAPRGGASFYVEGGFKPPVEAACLRYRVYFPSDFNFAKGGKLPGLYGGVNAKGESAAGCRAGVEEDGFSTRYMWRENGAGSLYAYFPGKSKSCGEYIGKGTWHFRRGAWTTLEQEVVLNTPGKEDGIVRVWANDKLVIDQVGIVLRKKAGIGIDGIFFVSFFGGKDTAWASPKDQSAAFSDVAAFFP